MRARLGTLSSQSSELVRELTHAQSELSKLKAKHHEQVDVLRRELKSANDNAERSEEELGKLRPAVRVLHKTFAKHTCLFSLLL